MPIDSHKRAADKRQALMLMVEKQGDDQLHGQAFNPWQAEFNAFAATTWRELEDEGLIEDRGERPGPSFRLTAHGWLTGLEWSGALEAEDIRSRAIAIRQALKAQVKGRRQHYGSSLDARDLADGLNLPRGWVLNAMQANLLQKLFPNDLMNATIDGTMIRIPLTFDMAAE